MSNMCRALPHCSPRSRLLRGRDEDFLGAAAPGAQSHGGEAIGVIPENLFDNQIKHRIVRLPNRLTEYDLPLCPR
jgi:hypothetical protein